MADVTGPVRTLPGNRSSVPDGQECDDCSAPAVIRVQGETDSFGAEYIDLCKSCHEKMKAEAAAYEGMIVPCDWCKADTLDKELRPQRDIDEGLHGRVYYVCKDCRDRYQKYLEEDDDLYW